MKKDKCDKSLRIIIAGEGGQGVQTIAKILAKSAFENDYHTSFIPNFGTEQRGGISLAFIRISCEPIISPKFQSADIFILLSSRDISRALSYIGPNTNVIYDQDLVSENIAKKIADRSQNLVPIPAFRKATENFSERNFNIIILGIVTGLVDANLRETIKANMNKKFDKYYRDKPELKKMNEESLIYGLKLTEP